MERLTEEKQIGAFASLKDKSEAIPGAFADYGCLYAHMIAVTRLKAYEDTGLEPEGVESLSADNAQLKSLLKIQKASCSLVKTVEAANLKDENARLRAELDAAVADMSGICYLCGNAKQHRAGSPTMMTCKHMDCLATMKKPGCKFFKWRGAKGEK